MNRSDVVLATIALQGAEVLLSPVQVQKLFFILDREISYSIGGPHFHFKPYDYGPFDADVYSEIEKLVEAGLAQIDKGYQYRIYRLTDEGLKKGLKLADNLPESARKYIVTVGSFVRRLSFQELVSSIYKKYPEMREKSVFRE
ncbi:MAG: hypothetical protein U1F76_10380 [Candidatus Competibacteraceae bacterium]